MFPSAIVQATVDHLYSLSAIKLEIHLSLLVGLDPSRELLVKDLILSPNPMEYCLYSYPILVDVIHVY